MKKHLTKKAILSYLSKGLLFIAVVAGTTVAINYFTNDTTKSTVDELLELDTDATNEQPQEESAESAAGIAVPGFEKLIFQANSATQEVSFENPEQNDVYFIVSLSIGDETVYESKLIEPGKGIYSIELPNSYPAGEYSGKLSYETRSMSDPTQQKNGAELQVPVIFE